MVFFTCILKDSNHLIYYSLRNGELNVKNNTFSRGKNFVFLFFIGHNNEWVKKISKGNVWLKMLYFNIYLFIHLIRKTFFQTYIWNEWIIISPVSESAASFKIQVLNYYPVYNFVRNRLKFIFNDFNARYKGRINIVIRSNEMCNLQFVTNYQYENKRRVPETMRFPDTIRKLISYSRSKIWSMIKFDLEFVLMTINSALRSL